jgi:amino acid transporter
MSQSREAPETVPAHLSVWDAVSIIIGIVVGTGIFETPPFIFSQFSSTEWAMSAWILGGVLSLIGALCYAELATTYQRSGGDYVYLGRAYGSWVGFLFGWAQLAVILTGSIGMMAYVFADYSIRLFALPPETGWLLAAAPVVVLTGLNILGIRFGKGTQNILTIVKVVGLSAIVAAGFAWPSTAPDIQPVRPALGGALGTSAVLFPPGSNFAFAMVLILLTYGGWNDAAYVAAEVRAGARNIPRALILGTAGITLIYLLVNGAYLTGLGFDGARNSRAVAADVLARPLGEWGERCMCLLVMVSALGTVNGLIYAGSRIYSTLGTDHAVFGWLGRWHGLRGTPYVALLTQASICLAMIAVIGSSFGREAVDSLFTSLGVGKISWEGHGGFETLLRCTAPIFWIFFLLTALSLFVLRFKDRDLPRVFAVPLYPIIPMIFCGSCFYMLHSSINYAGALGLIGAGLLLAGLPLYWLSRRL